MSEGTRQQVFARCVELFVSATGLSLERQQAQRKLFMSLGYATFAKAAADLGAASRLAGYDHQRGWVEMGKALSPIARGTANDTDLLAALMFAFQQHESGVLDPLLWSARWFQSHLPTVRLTPEQFAAFACTDIDLETLAEIRAPWPSFQIVFPDPTFPIVIANNMPGVGAGIVRANRIAVHAWRGSPDDSAGSGLPGTRALADGLWSLRIDAGTASFNANRQVLEELYEDLPIDAITPGGIALEALEDRALRVGKRVALNTMLAIQQYTARPTSGKARRARKFQTVKNLEEYTIGAPVTCNVLSSVHEYLSGEQSHQCKVRWCVRGHWRNQACGVGRLERKRLWVAPHYKGHGPRIIRDHVLAGSP